MKQAFDCVIVGGGGAGASLALTLGQLHYRVLLIEKNADPNIQPPALARTVGLSYTSAQIYADLDVWKRLQPHAVPIEQVVVSVQGQFGTCRLHHQQLNVPALGYVVSLAEIEQTLYEKLTALPQVTLARPATLIQASPSPEGWHGEFQLGEHSQHFFSRLLVAADGIASPLRQLQGIGCSQRMYDHVAVMANVQMAEHHCTAIERFLPDGAIALLPWRENLATCVWTTSAENAPKLLAMSEQDYLRACQRQLGARAGQLQKIHRRISVPLGMQLATQQTGSRFLLLGNAAHNLHPIAAQGLNLSLRDVWQIRQQCKKSQHLLDLGRSDFLDEYMNARRVDQNRVVFGTDKIARFMSGGPLPPSLRAMGMTLFDCLTPIKRQFALYCMGFS